MYIYIYDLQVHKLRKNSLDIHKQGSSLPYSPEKWIGVSGSRFPHCLNANRDKRAFVVVISIINQIA